MIDKAKGLSYNITAETGFELVSLSGDLNMFSAPELRTVLIKKFDAGSSRFVFDLTELTFVDSSGIGTLVSFVSLSKKREGAKVILCGLNPQIKNIFEVTRLLSVFNVVETLDEAKTEIAV